MDSYPSSTELVLKPLQFTSNWFHFCAPEPVTFSQLNRAIGTVQLENGLDPFTDHVNVFRAMIVGVNHHAVTCKPQNGRHSL
jgi:hypothetical protein